jgi:hypothetical protein
MEDFTPAKFTDVRRNRGSSADVDYKNVMVVASAWLVLYVAMLSGLLSNQGRELLASVALLAQF